MNDITWVPADKRAVVTDSGTSGHSRILLSEQTAVVWMSDVIPRSIYPRHAVLDPEPSLIASAKAFMQPLGHLWLVTCEISTAYLKESLLKAVEVFTR